MLNLTFRTGAGISLESGLPLYTNPAETKVHESRFGYKLQDMQDNRERPIEYYNLIANKVSHATPSDAHCFIASLEAHYNVSVITQNIDDLHERAGSNKVVHLHGQINYQHTEQHCCRREKTYERIAYNNKCKHGSRWRHSIVLYDDPVQGVKAARRICALTDVLIVIGCSMQTNTANLLVKQVHEACPVYFVNPHPSVIPERSKEIKAPAYQGIWTVLSELTGSTISLNGV